MCQNNSGKRLRETDPSEPDKRLKISEKPSQPFWVYDEGILRALQDHVKGWDWHSLSLTCRALRDYPVSTKIQVTNILALRAKITVGNGVSATEELGEMLRGLPKTVTELEIHGLSSSVKEVRIPYWIRELVLQADDDHVIPIRYEREPITNTFQIPDASDGLKGLTLPDAWDFDIIEKMLPRSLVRLNVGSEHKSAIYVPDMPFLSRVRTGSGLKMHQSKFPPSLRVLQFGENFNEPIDYLKLPKQLDTLKFGKSFNQPVEHIELPEKLRHLEFGDDFDESLSNFNFPRGLEELKFGRRFNKGGYDMSLPDKLKVLRFGKRFNQTLDLPKGLRHLEIGSDYNQPFDGGNLPDNVRIIRK